MTAIYKAPGCAPEVIDIPNTLEALQEKVGGVHRDRDVCHRCRNHLQRGGTAHGSAV